MFYALFVRGYYFVQYGLYQSAFPTYSFKRLVFCLSVLCTFCLFCFQLNVIIYVKLVIVISYSLL